VVIRCPTTDDARRLRTAALAGAVPVPRGHRVTVHCLNRRSAELLRGLQDLGLRPVVRCNTAQPRPRGKLAVASPPAKPSVFYCGRADRSKNLEGLLEAWSLVPTERSLNLFGPQQLQRFASREQRVVYGGCYQGEPPFRLGDVVVLPSFREGHENVLVEAFRAGAVVVGSAVPGVEEHLADDRGILVGRPLKARSIATAMALAVALPADQRARLRLRARAYFDGNFASPCSSAIHVLRVCSRGSRRALDAVGFRNPDVTPRPQTWRCSTGWPGRPARLVPGQRGLHETIDSNRGRSQWAFSAPAAEHLSVGTRPARRCRTFTLLRADQATSDAYELRNSGCTPCVELLPAGTASGPVRQVPRWAWVPSRPRACLVPASYCAPWPSTAGSRRAATGPCRDAKTCRQTIVNGSRMWTPWRGARGF
jgi:hypothetical protein